MAVFCIFAKWPLNPVSNISVGMLKLNWWTGRTSGSLSSSFLGTLGQIYPVPVLLPPEGCFLKGSRVTSLLCSDPERFPLSPRPKPTPCLPRPLLSTPLVPLVPPLCPHPPVLTALHPHQPCCFLNTGSHFHFRASALASPSTLKAFSPDFLHDLLFLVN